MCQGHGEASGTGVEAEIGVDVGLHHPRGVPCRVVGAVTTVKSEAAHFHPRLFQEGDMVGPSTGKGSFGGRETFTFTGAGDGGLEAGASPGAEGRPRNRHIQIDVGDPSVAKRAQVLLHPFGGTHQAPFLSIPGPQNESAFRFPTPSGGGPEDAGGFQENRGPGSVVDGAPAPGVPVGSENHP